MVLVMLQIVAHTTFGLLMRHARSDPQTYFRVGATNYWTALVLALTAVFFTGGLHVEWPVSLLAIYQGIQYQITYILLFTLIAIGGLAVTFTILRMSVVVPILGSILLWGESPEILRIIGILMMLAALPLIGADARHKAGLSGLRVTALLMLVAIGITGTGALAAKSFAEIRVQSNALDYSVLTFVGASVSTVVTWPLVQRLVRKHQIADTPHLERTGRPWKSWLPIGIGLGVANIIQNSALVEALSQIPGTLVFPVIVSSYLLLILLADYTIWKLRFGQVTLAGILLAITGLVLANL